MVKRFTQRITLGPEDGYLPGTEAIKKLASDTEILNRLADLEDWLEPILSAEAALSQLPNTSSLASSEAAFSVDQIRSLVEFVRSAPLQQA